MAAGRSIEGKGDTRDLNAIAADLRREVEGADLAWRNALDHAVRAGELLAEAKAQVKHGEWLSWLGANFRGAPRTAQDYMRLARHAEDARALAHLGVQGALAALAKPRALPPADEPTSIETPGEDADHLTKAKYCIEMAEVQARELLALAAEMAPEHPAVAAAAAEYGAQLLSDPWEASEARNRLGLSIARAEAGQV